MHLKCLFCLDLFDSTQETVTTPCGHIYHITCITPWMTQHDNCPECRNNCSIDNLFRIYFSGASDETVHLNNNCPNQELLDIEKEQVTKLKDDNEKLTNDFDEMSEEKEKLETDLQIANDKITTLTADLLKSTEENLKIKTDLQTSEEKCINFPSVIESFMNKTLELESIIESLKQDAERATLESNFQQKQLDEALLQNFNESESHQQLQLLNSFRDNNDNVNNNNDSEDIEMYQCLVASLETDIERRLTEFNDLKVQLNSELIKNQQLKDILHTTKTELIELKLLNISLRLENPTNNNNSVQLELAQNRQQNEQELHRKDEEIKELKRINLALANNSLASQIIPSPRRINKIPIQVIASTSNTNLQCQQELSLDVVTVKEDVVTVNEEIIKNVND